MGEGTGHAQAVELDPPGVGADIEDEALAAAARARYRIEGIATIEPDEGVRAALRPGEELLALRGLAIVERFPHRDEPPAPGRLAITTDRMILVDGRAVTLAWLDELEDVTLITDGLLVVLASGAGFSVNVAQPRLLRVQLAAARAGRPGGQAEASVDQGSDSPNDLPRR